MAPTGIVWPVEDIKIEGAKKSGHKISEYCISDYMGIAQICGAGFSMRSNDIVLIGRLRVVLVAGLPIVRGFADPLVVPSVFAGV